MATRISSSLWGRWFDENDERALRLAAGASTLKKLRQQAKGELPPEVVALLAIADLAIFERYARELVDDEAMRGRYVARIRAEFSSATAMLLAVLGHERLLEADPTLERSIALRNPYVDPLSLMQVRLLRAYRRGGKTDVHLGNAIRLSINGVSAGLRVTG